MLSTTRSIYSTTGLVSRTNSHHRRQNIVHCTSGDASHGTGRPSRREGLIAAVSLCLAVTQSPSPVFAVKLPGGFNIVKDVTDGYQYLAPLGWQEIVLEGQDSVYKDLIEPLENVSVTLFPVNKKTIRDYGPLNEVAFGLADKVLTPASQKVKIIDTSEREIEGIPYYSFEFETSAPTYSRHALVVVVVGNGNFYTLVTGSSERRFKKIEATLRTVIKSFQVIVPATI